jgi:ABC-2 type transporter
VTLHQPRSDIYQLIDNVVVLAKGGRVAYSGPRSEVGAAFSNAGFPIPELFNPADFLLDTLSNPTRVGRMIDIWQKSKLALTSEASGEQEKPIYDNMGAEVSTSTAMRTPMYIALSVVVERMVKNLWRQQSSMCPAVFVR